MTIRLDSEFYTAIMEDTFRKNVAYRVLITRHPLESHAVSDWLVERFCPLPKGSV